MHFVNYIHWWGHESCKNYLQNFEQAYTVYFQLAGGNDAFFAEELEKIIKRKLGYKVFYYQEYDFYFLKQFTDML